MDLRIIAYFFFENPIVVAIYRRDFRLQSGYPVILPHPVIWDDVSEDVVELVSLRVTSQLGVNG